MATVTMTLYQALAKKKILEDQVEKIRTYRFCGVKKKASDVVTSDNITTTEALESFQSARDKSISLLTNLSELKAVINAANATTEVTIAGKVYTIANAIARYRMLDKFEEQYKRMLMNIASCKAEVEKKNSTYLDPDKISAYVKQVLGDSKKDQALIDSTTKAYTEQYEVELYDPLNTEELATKGLEEIAEFREQFHYSLTEVNCKTMITVEFTD